LRQLPSRHAPQHAVGVLDGVHVSVVAFNHVDGGSHLFGKEVHVYAFLQAEGCIGMAEVIGRARHVLCALAQIRLVQKVGNQRVVESFCGLACNVRKYSVVRCRGFGDCANAFQIIFDALGSHQLARFAARSGTFTRWRS
jgi:hypothetical protein